MTCFLFIAAAGALVLGNIVSNNDKLHCCPKQQRGPTVAAHSGGLQWGPTVGACSGGLQSVLPILEVCKHSPVGGLQKGPTVAAYSGGLQTVLPIWVCVQALACLKAMKRTLRRICCVSGCVLAVGYWCCAVLLVVSCLLQP